jgi:hypothetical protein
VKLPGRPNRDTRTVAAKEWAVIRFADRTQTGQVMYEAAVGAVAVGPAPPALVRLGTPDDEWFKAVGAVACPAPEGSNLDAEAAVRSGERLPGRQYYYKGADNLNRVVRLYRNKEQAILLSVEGPFLTPTHPDVDRFLSSLKVPLAGAFGRQQ